jgi:hypothetical protein
MRKIIKVNLLLCLFFVLGSLDLPAQNINNEAVKPKGFYSEIANKTSNDLRIIKLLADSNYKGRTVLIDSVIQIANSHTPPVLYFLSAALYQLNKKDDASFWFYVAQLRARYDVNRCTDKTASAARYNQNFGPVINTYAMKDAVKLEDIIIKVVDFVKQNDEKYEHRWINMEGMKAMNFNLGNSKEAKSLSLPEAEWAAIKAQTIKTYWDGFKAALVELKSKQ